MNEGQETRTETVGLKVTPSEERAVRFVADARGVSRSELLRQMTVSAIVEEYGEMRVKLGLTIEGAA